MNQLRDNIESLPKEKHIELAHILIHKYKVQHDVNTNGIFINLSALSPEIMAVIQEFYDSI
jgi:hypothetical protein